MSSPIDTFAAMVLGELAQRFPVCTASDEFHFFPQVRDPDAEWEVWDDFSAAALQETGGRFSHWQRELDRLEGRNLPFGQQVEARMLRRVLRTLAQQLADVAPQRSQPSFHLTVLGIGLTEAIEAGPGPARTRLRSAPAFIDRARSTLDRVPEIFRDLGREMIRRQVLWLQALETSGLPATAVVDALARLDRHLDRIPAVPDFRLPTELYEHIASDHMGCGLPADEIADRLARELRAAENALAACAAEIDPGRTWREVADRQPAPAPPPGGAAALYRDVIAQLAEHCRQIGLISADRIAACPVQVIEVAEFMRPVRSNAAFSMPPVHPPAGGTFHIMPDAGQSAPADYRLLTAHETYPGHHLLDTRRWGQEHRVRRHLEFPLFYEGWASFAEELLFDTGFFSGPTDRLLLSKRRYWRAVRGKIDLEIHTGRRTLRQAAGRLADFGLQPDKALSMVKRYALKPGYQLSYTLGSRRFRRLYERFIEKHHRPTAFARLVLAQGETEFDDLESVLEQEGATS